MPGKHSDFSDTNAAGRKYKSKPKAKAERRTPRRDKQVARGPRFDQIARGQVASARQAMKRGRFSAPGS